MGGIQRLASRFLPAVVRAPLGRMLSAPRAYGLARRVLQSYSRHYAGAQQQYRLDGLVPATDRPSLETVGVRTIVPGGPLNPFALPSSYGRLVDRIGRDVSERLSWTSNCRLHPPPTSGARTDRTDDVEEVRNGDVITLQLADPLTLDGLEDLCAGVIPEIERAIYGSYVLVDKVYVVRTLVSRYRPHGSSWVWHYDEHPPEILKLLVYLTDVSEGTAPFTYLSSGDSGSAVMGTRNPLYGESRISASVMTAHHARGRRAQPVIGPRGTAVLFNDNVIHRATFAEQRHRDALILQLRPATQRRLPYVDPRWTGSYQHRDFNRDPERLQPEIWPPPQRT